MQPRNPAANSRPAGENLHGSKYSVVCPWNPAASARTSRAHAPGRSSRPPRRRAQPPAGAAGVNPSPAARSADRISAKSNRRRSPGDHCRGRHRKSWRGQRQIPRHAHPGRPALGGNRSCRSFRLRQGAGHRRRVPRRRRRHSDGLSSHPAEQQAPGTAARRAPGQLFPARAIIPAA